MMLFVAWRFSTTYMQLIFYQLCIIWKEIRFLIHCLLQSDKLITSILTFPVHRVHLRSQMYTVHSSVSIEWLHHFYISMLKGFAQSRDILSACLHFLLNIQHKKETESFLVISCLLIGTNKPLKWVLTSLTRRWHNKYTFQIRSLHYLSALLFAINEVINY